MVIKNQIAVNLITNVLAMGITTLISIWMTPYLINQLGLAAYGYVGVLNNLINFMTVLTYMLTSMVGRFLIVSLERNGPQEASQYVSSALFTNLVFGVILLPIILLLGYNLDGLLKIQEEYIVDVEITFVLASIAFILTALSQVFAAGSYCKNRLDIRNGILIFSNIVRVAVIVLLFSVIKAQIWYIAIASVLQGLISIVLTAYSFKVLLPDIHFHIKLFKLHNSIELLSAGFMISVIILGNNFLTQIDLVVGNRYLPAEIVGMYAAILLLPNSIRNIASAISSAFTPTTISIYSSGNMHELCKYSNRVVKFCGFLIGWPVAIICVLAIPILNIWLGKDYSQYELIIILMLLPLTIHLAVNQLFNVQQATNKLKLPAVVSVLLGVMGLCLAIFFTASLRMGILGIVLSGVLLSTIRNTIFMPIYTAIITNQPKFVYYKGIIPPFFVSFMTCAIGISAQRFININSVASIIYSAFVLTIFYITITLVSLSSKEREAVLNHGIRIVRMFSTKILHA